MIEVRATKYDGSGLRTWTAHVLRRDGPLLVLDASFDHDIEHDLLGNITRGTKSIEYYWLDRWYNVFRLADPAGGLRSFYCNITAPPEFDERVLSYLDLDIDVLVEPDFSYQIVDLEDFEQNAGRFGYSDAVQSSAHKALDDLVELIEQRAFPFNTNGL